MKAQILHVENPTNKKTGETNFAMTILANFSSYGSIRPASAQVKLNSETYEKYKTQIGKEVDLDVVIPTPEYPLHLR